MNELALFAGAGGGLLATHWLLGWKTVCYVENARYPVEVIKARIRDGLLEDAPIWDDVRTFDGRPWAGLVDIVTAGFPCQPFSTAGKMRGEDDPRNGWPSTIRIIREVRPSYLLLENVAGLITFDYFRRILGDLSESGYFYKWGILSAAGVGAPHLRKRIWIVAYASSEQGRLSQGAGRYCHEVVRRGQNLAYTDRLGCGWRHDDQQGKIEADQSKCGSERIDTEVYTDPQGERCNRRGMLSKTPEQEGGICVEGNQWWSVEPGMGRVAHGVAHRVDRIRALGNGQVPAVVRKAWDLLS